MSIFFAPSPSSVDYATSAGSAGLATSSTSALNAAQAPNGFIVTGTLSATTVSATTYLNLGNTTAQWNASAIQSSPLSATLVPTTNQVLVYNGSVWTASTVTTGGGGVTDHGALTGLADDDHPQYVLSATNNALSSTVSNHIASASVHFTQAQIDHGTISGLGDNDHPQYVLSSTNNTLSSTVSNHLASAVHWDLTTLNTNYINASGDSVNAAFYFQTLSATTVSATNYLNLPSGVATWNANKLQGYDISAVAPSNDQVLKYNSTLSAWVPGTDNTGGGVADASSLRGSPLSATLVPTAGQALMYNGSVWTASAALFAYTYGSGAPSGGSNGDIYLQTDVVALQVPSVSATNLSATNGDLSSIKLTDYSESKSSPTISASALTLNLNNSQVFTVALNSNISTVTISNVESRANTAQGFTLILTADGTARTITWPASVKWPSGTGPTLTSTNNKVDILSFLTPDNGTTWYGFVGGQNF